MKKNNRARVVALVLVLIVLVSTLYGCYGVGSVKNDSVNSTPTGDTTVALPTNGPISGPTITQTVNNGIRVTTSDDELLDSESWEDYIGNLDVFVYGLIATDLGNHFEIFPALVALPDGQEVCGIAYTDYSECYETDDERGIVSVGFVSGIGDDGIPIEDFDSGLIVENLEIPDVSYDYLLTCRSKSYKGHCVVYGQYLIYGIDDSGCITYESTPFQQGVCDESLGALYSYDEGRFLFDPNVGTFVPLTGVSMVDSIDYPAIEKEINDTIARQDLNFVRIDTESCVSISKNAVKSYLLSLQEETFLGYDVETLIGLADELDARECFRITEDGLVVISVKPDFREASSLMKWVIGSTTVIVFTVSSVGTLVASECPIISSACGAIAGTAIELFMQVVLESKDVRDVNWNTVMLAAATGAIGGAIYPYVGAFSDTSIAYDVIDTLIDGTLGGAERVLRAKFNGSDWDEAVDQFGAGFLIATGLSIGTKSLFNGLGKATPKQPVSVQSKSSQQGILSKIKGKISGLKKTLDGSKFHSEYLMRRHLSPQVPHSIKTLSGTIKDMDGNLISKKQLADIALKAKNGEQVGVIVSKTGEVRPLRKWNQNVGTDFAQDAVATAKVKKLVAGRKKNYTNAAEVLLAEWKKNPSSIPKEIAELLGETGNSIEDITTEIFVKIIRKSKYVFHECADLSTVIIMSRAVHSEFRHAGGYSVAKAVEIRLAKMEFTKLAGIAVIGGSY